MNICNLFLTVDFLMLGGDVTWNLETYAIAFSYLLMDLL